MAGARACIVGDCAMSIMGQEEAWKTCPDDFNVSGGEALIFGMVSTGLLRL